MKRVDTAVRNIHYHCLEYDHEQLGDLYLVACGMEDCDPGAACGPDIRDCFHLHVVRSGKGILRTGSHEYEIHGGQMFLLKDGEKAFYAADNDEPWSYCWVTFHGSSARKTIEEIGFRDGVYTLPSSVPPENFFDLIRKMHQKPEMNRINELYRNGILLEFLSLAMEAGGYTSVAAELQNKKPVEEYIDSAATFIHYNYRTITVNDVVSFIGFSRGYLSSTFKKAKGISLQEYLLQVRMQKAKELLDSTNWQIQEISEKVGYEDQLNFSRIFRKYEGISPSEYRRKKHEK